MTAIDLKAMCPAVSRAMFAIQSVTARRGMRRWSLPARDQDGVRPSERK